MTSTPRMVVPDVARGMALLGIAIANIAVAWTQDLTLPGNQLGGVVDDSGADKAAVVFAATFAHNRGLPMFSTLLGFGVGLIAVNLWRRGFPRQRARRVLLRRYFFLGVAGALHAALLFPKEIMLTYGIAGMILALIFRLRNKWLLAIAGVLFLGRLKSAVSTVIDIARGVDVPTEPADSSVASGDLADALPHTFAQMIAGTGGRVISDVIMGVFSVQYLLPVMIVGFVWARAGVLSRMERHRGQLWGWAIAGAVVCCAVGLPWGLSQTGIAFTQHGEQLRMLNTSLGLVTGPGILAGLALLLDGVQKRTEQGAALPAWLSPFSALGKRSMSGYICQSILFFIFVYPFTLDAAHGVGAAGKTAIAFVVWFTTLAGAYLLECAGKRGPFEWLHRRVSYGATGRAEYDPTHPDAAPPAPQRPEEFAAANIGYQRPQ